MPLTTQAADVQEANSATGTASANRNTTTSTGRMVFTTRNQSSTTNDVALHLNTGNNAMVGNTIAGGLTTGTIDARVDVSNVNNAGACTHCPTVLSAQDKNVSAALTNDKTGAMSENKNSVNVTNHTTVNQVDISHIDNLVSLLGDTGHNTNRFNTVSGPTTTGNILATVRLNTVTGQVPSRPLPLVGPIIPPSHLTPPPSQVPSNIPGMGEHEIALVPATMAPHAPRRSGMFFPAGASLVPSLIALVCMMIGSGWAFIKRNYGSVHSKVD